ncbi:hypothetical protein THRCLA_21724 [Thraustotheca clavata]|uniref:Uncharacterized protein n=1 Tax=Thraustotheca clavata TaxID=74557 RepID=A0A1V9ZQB2_9STRA|nr:hypothetical protein THRCLA_21724 [Thraustotheca clavata]
MKHIADRKYTSDSELERATLTGGSTEEAKPIYIEDKWTFSGIWNDQIARKRLMLLFCGIVLLLTGAALGYRAATVPGTLRTLPSPDGLSFGTFHDTPHKFATTPSP